MRLRIPHRLQQRMELMARNPDGTFQQGDPETRQAAQKGGQVSHGSHQNQGHKKHSNQNQDDKIRQQQSGGMSQGRGQQALQAAKRPSQLPSEEAGDGNDMSRKGHIEQDE